MTDIQNTNTVKAQYRDASRLNTRISIHEKYSVNKQGFGAWIFEQYDISPGTRILELGCGNGDIWRNRIDCLPEGVSLVLSDFSEGMLKETKVNLPASANVSYQQIDIQAIPFEGDSFDIVIANMILYHVPDLDKGLSEVRRVLREGGMFYCATYGEHGIAEYVQTLMAGSKHMQKMSNAFTLQNGENILRRYFIDVEQRVYEDHLEVTDVEDMVDYILSLGSMAGLGQVSRDELRSVLDSKKEDGRINVPKEYGMFVSG